MMVKRSILVAGRKTSVSLEQEFWDAFKDISRVLGRSLTDIASEIDSKRKGNLSSAIRVFVLNRLQS